MFYLIAIKSMSCGFYFTDFFIPTSARKCDRRCIAGGGTGHARVVGRNAADLGEVNLV
jgi:hypothetical protein